LAAVTAADKPHANVIQDNEFAKLCNYASQMRIDFMLLTNGLQHPATAEKADLVKQ
jgi:hypothetical protein